ncbi:MAG: hypothetical protein U5N58_13860 [Actinomycetota bacterium]|nr:hypothetical protein [Actinomycetota bacterium]
MEFKNSAIDLIKIRRSIRSYKDINLKQEDKEYYWFHKKNHNNIFGCKLRFDFIDASDLNPDDLRNLGTYGIIKGAKYFIGGTISKNDKRNYCLVDFGYVFEK